MPIGPWVVKTLLPLLCSTSLAVAAGFCTHHVMHEGFARLVISGIVSESVLGLLAWYFVFDSEERSVVVEKVKCAMRRFNVVKGTL